ncbi:hypothetical protein [Notoacmeibacter sp. MSK16QG-6]|uniref:phage tail assembly chaperone n=1 Tax=Notoacmeibacter sp. MSK16QG-6 TaxID=2957982 RepID=UPI0020A03489|nr:hypothetical protein [Notoacmeibacter sp. MSK16QG-6]MCP1200052.1 hypothetical protein [Notoacmeibacter sp. MSK16QG-6]
MELAWGGEVVPALINEPSLLPGLDFVFEAFFRLSSDRPVSQGDHGPIPYRSVMHEAEGMGMGVEEANWFHALIRAMDNEYLDWLQEQRPGY